MADHVTIVEMGPRDGLQNEKCMVATDDKIRLVDLLSATGLTRIEVTSFVSLRWVPQMADAAEVMAGINRARGVEYSVLTPNLRGFEAALAAGADAVAVFASASESFSRANINASVAESLERFIPVLEEAGEAGIRVRGYVSCVTDCPYSGEVAPAEVAQVAAALFEMGCHEISLGDTVGRGKPERVDAMLDAVLDAVPAGRLAGHFHDTGGLAIPNIGVALERGLRVFDAATGGLGGCPFAPGAAGNVATETVVEMLETLGFNTGIDPLKLAAAGEFARSLRGKP
jgi:hydroxymethylglutaryl-CoA lyase